MTERPNGLILGVIAIALVLLSFIPIMSGSVVPDVDTAALWHFDEGSGSSVKDESSNNNDGVVHGALWTSGKFGNALSFDGADDYIEVQDTNSLDITSELTIEAWVYQIGTIGDAQRIVHKTYQKNYEFWVYDSGQVGLRIGDGTGTNDFIESVTKIKKNEWYHIATTYDGSSMKLYINGSLDASKTTTISSLGITTDPVVIGNVMTDSGMFNYDRPFNGKLDEIRISNRARSDQEIYNAASGRQTYYVNNTYENTTYINNTYTNVTYENNTYQNYTTEEYYTTNVTYENSTQLYQNITYENTTYVSYLNETPQNYSSIVYGNQTHVYPNYYSNQTFNNQTKLPAEKSSQDSGLNDYLIIILIIIVIVIQIFFLSSQRKILKQHLESSSTAVPEMAYKPQFQSEVVQDLPPVPKQQTQYLPPTPVQEQWQPPQQPK